jgi:hypothetical protein
MPDTFTEREDAVIALVTAALDGMNLDARVVNFHKLEGGEAVTVQFTVNNVVSTDLERARIDASGETPEALASAVVEELKRQLPAA